MRRILLILAVAAMVVAMLGVSAAPALADRSDFGDRFVNRDLEDLFDEDEDDDGDDFCILGTTEEDVLVPEETVFGTTDFDVVSLDVPCDDDDDDDDDDFDVFDVDRFDHDRFGEHFFVG